MISQRPEASVRRDCWPITGGALEVMCPQYVVARDAWANEIILCDGGHILWDHRMAGGPWVARSFNDWVPEESRYRQTKTTRCIKICRMCRVFFVADDVIEAAFSVEDAEQVFQIMGAIRNESVKSVAAAGLGQREPVMDPFRRESDNETGPGPGGN